MLLGVFVCQIEHTAQIRRHIDITVGVLHAGQIIQNFLQLAAQVVNFKARLTEQRFYRTTLLIKQCRNQMHRLDNTVISPHCQGLGVGQSGLKFAGQSINSHDLPLEYRMLSLFSGLKL